VGSCYLLHFTDEGVKALLELPMPQFPVSPLSTRWGHWCQSCADIPRRCSGCRRFLAVPSKRSMSPACRVMQTNAQRVMARGVGRGCCKEIQSHTPWGERVDDWIRQQLSPEETDNFKTIFFLFKKAINISQAWRKKHDACIVTIQGTRHEISTLRVLFLHLIFFHIA